MFCWIKIAGRTLNNGSLLLICLLSLKIKENKNFPLYSRSQRAISAIPTQISSQNFSDLNECGTNFNMASWEKKIN